MALRNPAGLGNDNRYHGISGGRVPIRHRKRLIRRLDKGEKEWLSVNNYGMYLHYDKRDYTTR